MPIELPNLDDRSFAELVEEGKRLIPSYAPDWTDHNPSDPGITLIELFASVAETLIYRVNRISESNKRAFVRLLAPDRVQPLGLSVDQELSATIRELRIEERAVTAADFERLALQIGGIARACCVPRRNLEQSSAEALGHVSLVVLSAPHQNAQQLLQAVSHDLAQRCLLTTRLHVVAPARLRVAVNLTLRIDADRLPHVVEQRVLAALHAFFDPYAGGIDRTGWPFGAPIHRSDVYAVLEQVGGVDYVDLSSGADALFTVDPGAGDRKILSGPSNVGLRLEAHELVDFSSAASTVDCQVTKLHVPG